MENGWMKYMCVIVIFIILISLPPNKRLVLYHFADCFSFVPAMLLLLNVSVIFSCCDDEPPKVHVHGRRLVLYNYWMLETLSCRTSTSQNDKSRIHVLLQVNCE